MGENMRLAFQGIWGHKMRSFLTMLGIIIGIASIITIVTAIKGANDLIKRNLVGSGKNTVKVTLSAGENEYTFESADELPAGLAPVTDSAMEKIRGFEGVENATAYLSRYASGSVRHGENSVSSLYVYGIDDRYFSTCGYAIETGRPFDAADGDECRAVMILDETAARSLFGDDSPIGKEAEVSGTPFTVVGVVKETHVFTPTITSMEDYYMYRRETNGQIFIPKDCWPLIYGFDEPENVIVKAATTDDMTRIGKKTADELNKYVSVKDGKVKYAAEDLLGQASQMQQLNSSTNMQLIWIAGISLLVGGIGVMNIMLVSVTERTSEIGLKKAIGAKKMVILAQFLTEAAVLTSLGGALGVASGIGIAYAMHKMTDIAFSIDVPASVGAVVFSMAIGLIFGFMPSVKAAGLNPIEALRRE